MSKHMSRQQLDCIVIGYNDLDFQRVIDSARETRKYNPYYSELKRSSVQFTGRNIHYMELFNASIHAATGNDPQLNVCKLPSLGVFYLTSYLQKRGYITDHLNFYNDEQDRLIELLSNKPVSVAITTTFYTSPAPIVEIIQLVREHSPDTKIIIGGPYIYNVCSDLDELSQDCIFDSIGADIYVFDSQGEKTLSQILAELKNETPDLSQVPNLIFQQKKRTYARTERIIEDNNMDENVVDWSLFNKDSYTPTAQMRTARSCAFKCAFCRYPAVAGPLRLNSIDVLESELRKLNEQKVNNIVFIDDTFNVPLRRFKDICRMMIRNKFDFNWFSYFRCSNSDDEAIDLMADAGCKGVFLGIESGDQSILNNMNKTVTIDKYRNGIRKLKERGIVTHAALIIGFPGETAETVQNTIDFIEETAPTFYSAGVWYFDPKAPVSHKVEEFGIQGGGMAWTHNTMNWKEADALVDHVYRSIKNSTIFPAYMFDFWAIPYLTGIGISISQIEDFAKIAQTMLRSDLGDGNSKSDESEKQLIQFWSKNELPNIMQM